MKRAILMLAAMALLLGGVGQARAGVIITLSQDGANVDASGVGSLNITSLTFDFSVASRGVIWGTTAAVNLGSPTFTNPADYYSGFSGPSSIGPGTALFFPTPSSPGPPIGVDFTDSTKPDVIVPAGYHSGDPITSSATWANTTISGLGLTPGTYTWTWGSGADADSLTLQVGAPEPSTLALLATASTALYVRWRRRKVATAAA
jgi:hypothetical protein